MDHVELCKFNLAKPLERCQSGCGASLRPSQVAHHNCIEYLKGQLNSKDSEVKSLLKMIDEQDKEHRQLRQRIYHDSSVITYLTQQNARLKVYYDRLRSIESVGAHNQKGTANHCCCCGMVQQVKKEWAQISRSEDASCAWIQRTRSIHMNLNLPRNDRTGMPLIS